MFPHRHSITFTAPVQRCVNLTELNSQNSDNHTWILLSPSHSISIFAFLSSHASHIRLSPSKTDKCRTRKKQTTTTEILYTVPISKISMTILTVGRRGQSERGKSLCPMNLDGWKSGRERERKREQSAVKAQLREREGWRRAGTYRKTQKESETQRRTRMKPNGRREMGRQQREGNMWWE